MIVFSFDGNEFGTNYTAVILNGGGISLPGGTAQLVRRTGAWPLVSGASREGRALVLGVAIEGSSVDTLRDQLFQWFDPEDETPKKLAITDDDESNERYLYVQVDGDIVPRDVPNIYIIPLKVHDDVRWRAETETSDPWSITASGQTHEVTNDGTNDAWPSYEVEPTSAKSSGFPYKEFWSVTWRSDNPGFMYSVRLGPVDTAALVATATATTLAEDLTDVEDEIDLTDASSFPTAGSAYITDAVNGNEQIRWTGKTSNTLTGVVRGIGGTTAVAHSNGDAIAVSKVLANGDDLRVYVDGLEIDRWLDGMNSANTYAWINLDFVPQQTTTLRTAIASSGAISSIEVGEEIYDMRDGIILRIDDELFFATTRDLSDEKYTGITRALHNTSEAGHTAGAIVYWIQREINVVYGNPTLSAPDVDDDYKPAFSLAAADSDNEEWKYTEFGDDNGKRAGRWRPFANLILSGPKLGCYTGTEKTLADPYSVIGGWLAYYPSSYAGWALDHPCGIVNAAWADGKKRAADTSKYLVGLRYWPRSAPKSWWWTQAWVSAPSVDDTWESWSEAKAGSDWDPSELLAIAIYPGAAIQSSQFPMEVEVGTVTVYLNTTEVPAVMGCGEEGNYPLEATLINTTTGEIITISFVMDLNETLVVDVDEDTVTYDKDGSSQRQAVEPDSVRGRWLKLVPGVNELQFDDTGTTGVTLTTNFRERSYQ